MELTDEPSWFRNMKPRNGSCRSNVCFIVHPLTLLLNHVFKICIKSSSYIMIRLSCRSPCKHQSNEAKPLELCFHWCSVEQGTPSTCMWVNIKIKFYNEFNGILYKNSYPSKSSSVSVTAISPWNLEQTLKVTKGMIILMQAYYPDFHDYLKPKSLSYT